MFIKLSLDLRVRSYFDSSRFGPCQSSQVDFCQHELAQSVSLQVDFEVTRSTKMQRNHTNAAKYGKLQSTNYNTFL